MSLPYDSPPRRKLPIGVQTFREIRNDGCYYVDKTEDTSSTGRADLTLRLNGHMYVFEFKTVEKEATGEAMRQLREKGYADKYRHLGRPVHLIGVEFSREDRNVAAFEVERTA